MYVNRRLKNVGDFAERPPLPPPSCNCITSVLCCVEVVQNDQEKKENGDGG